MWILRNSSFGTTTLRWHILWQSHNQLYGSTSKCAHSMHFISYLITVRHSVLPFEGLLFSKWIDVLSRVFTDKSLSLFPPSIIVAIKCFNFSFDDWRFHCELSKCRLAYGEKLCKHEPMCGCAFVCMCMCVWVRACVYVCVCVQCRRR